MKFDRRLFSNGSEETARAGEEFAHSLRPGDVVALFGELGSGKTVFIKGVCRGMEVVDEVTSPSFTLIHEYTGRVPIYHFDFYRIENQDEFFELGCEEYFYGEGICLIEWADRIIEYLPTKRFEIYLKNLFYQGCENKREIFFRKL